MSDRPFVAAAIAAPFGRDVVGGLARMEDLLDEARRSHAELVVFPETTLGGYVREDMPPPRMLPPSLDIDGPEVRAVIEMAGDTVVCFGLTTEEQGERKNVALCVSGDGILGRHDKVHLPPAERFGYTPGSSFEAFDTPIGRIGMLICYDKLFPEAARALALDGAETLCSLASWPLDRRRPAPVPMDDRQVRHFDTADVARAIENQVTVVSSNMTGPWGDLTYLGSAKVVDPDGQVLARTDGVGAGTALAVVDPAADRAEALLDIDHLADRRPETYHVTSVTQPRRHAASG
jgi:predicted amidohydrolase